MHLKIVHIKGVPRQKTTELDNEIKFLISESIQTNFKKDIESELSYMGIGVVSVAMGWDVGA